MKMGIKKTRAAAANSYTGAMPKGIPNIFSVYHGSAENTRGEGKFYGKF